MLKKSVLLAAFVFFFASVGAFNTTIIEYNSTLLAANISNVTDLYAYEVNFDYSGSIYGVDHNNFLGSATYDYNENGGILSVYGSRLNSSRIGVNGSGLLFNVSHSSTISLRYTLEIYSNGTESYTYYNNTGSPPVPDTGDSGGNGGGGGGGSVDEFDVSPGLLNVRVTQGETIRRTVTITNKVNKDLQITSIDAGNLNSLLAAYFPDTPFYIPAGQSIEVTFDFFARSDTVPDAYVGEIIVKSPNSKEMISTVLEVVEKQPLFDLTVDLSKETYAPGEDVTAKIDVQNFGDLKDIDVLLNYAIKDFKGNVLTFEEGSYAVHNYRLQAVGKLTVPLGTPDGDYIFYAKASYPQQEVSASGSSAFKVSSSASSPLFGSAGLFLLIFVPVAIVAVVIVTLVIISNFRRPKVNGGS